MSKQVLLLSNSAISRLRSLSGKYEYIRLGLKTKGCSGLSYELSYTNTKEKFDELVEQREVRILIAPNVLMHVIGTQMDFVSNRLTSEFVFNNPNSKGECGCGESFKVI